MFEDRQVVDDHPEKQFLSPSFIGASTKGGAQDSLVLREGPLDVNSIPIDPLGKPPLQLTAVLRLWPFSAPAKVDGGDERSDSHGPTELMMGLTVVGAVGKNAIPPDSHRTVHDGRGELGSIIAGSTTHFGCHPQVSAHVAQNRQLGIGSREEGLGVGMFAAVVAADVPGFVTRRVNDSLRLGFDQAAASGLSSDEIEESIKELFFKRR